jgi:hypothetical protein
VSGNAAQRTTRGLLVWRKADNWTAFTDGFRTWIGGPAGLETRLNTQRFAWEADAAAFPRPAPPAGSAVLLAAGDVAACPTERLANAEATARLLDMFDGAIAVLGDTAYESGAEDEFVRCYGPTWGRHLARTYPAVGNHEYLTPGAAPYFRYFGGAAGDPARGYYDYRLGTWHVLVLNTNCEQIGGCGAGSPQERWLRAALAADPSLCTLAYMHHARFSSGSEHGSQPTLQPLWQALYDSGADLVLGAHDHHYERFAPKDPDGRLDPLRGLRSFVVGTGGNDLRGIGRLEPGSEVRDASVHGVLRLTLDPGGYTWEFVPEPGRTFRDTGSDRCH